MHTSADAANSLSIPLWITKGMSICPSRCRPRCMYTTIRLSIYLQYSIVGKPEGVSYVFLTYFDNFFGGQYKFGGWEAPEGWLTPQQIEHCKSTPLGAPLVSVCVSVHGVAFINVGVVGRARSSSPFYPSVHLSDLPGPYARPSVRSFSPSSPLIVNPRVIRML